MVTYPLLEDENGFYFEYGCEYKKLSLNDFLDANTNLIGLCCIGRNKDELMPEVL